MYWHVQVSRKLGLSDELQEVKYRVEIAEMLNWCNKINDDKNEPQLLGWQFCSWNLPISLYDLSILSYKPMTER